MHGREEVNETEQGLFATSHTATREMSEKDGNV